jgi:type VI secretion system protein ImpL
MKIRTLLFCLFLYVCLVWVGVFYYDSGPDTGLIWTAAGIGVTLALVVGAHLFGWLRIWRMRSAARPKATPSPAKAQPPAEEESAIAALLAEAGSNLAKVPAFRERKEPLSGAPLYLLIGPEGCGKTSNFLNSGAEPQLLAGQAAGPAFAATRLCSFWFAKNAVFAELSGKAFSGDPGKWKQLLAALRGTTALPWWRRLWQEPQSGMTLRGVIGFCEVKEFTNASADPQRFERYCRDWRERLRAVGEVFGGDFPVYQVITKCDALPYFAEFFRRMPESEAQQIFGCTLPFHRMDPSNADEVFADAEAKRLTEAFRPLYHSVAERRLIQLAHEPDPNQKPAIYEFPRELKRIRSSIVQFLTEACRPHALQPNPLLRGYYFTGVREVEAAAADRGGTRSEWFAGASMDATTIFRPDPTQVVRAEDLKKAAASGHRGQLVRQWIFLSDLFHSVILADRPLQAPPSAVPRMQLYRRAAFAGLCGLCFVLCASFAISWKRNTTLLNEVASTAAAGIQKHGNLATVDELQALDNLRLQIVRLENGATLFHHSGLYSGYKVLPGVKRVYFSRFQQLLLNDLNGNILEHLRAASSTAARESDDVHAMLKAHLMISSGTCRPEAAVVSRALKQAAAQLVPASGKWQELAGAQIDFYARNIAPRNPCAIREDSATVERVRQYLSTSVTSIYKSILADAEKAVTRPQRLGDLAPNYSQVLNGPREEISPVFSRTGWDFVEKSSKGRYAPALNDCVFGGRAPVAGAGQSETQIARAIQELYVRDYKEQWQKYLSAFSISRYTSAENAAHKLEILGGRKSPLLALFAMTASQTNFTSLSTLPAGGIVAKTVTKTVEKGEKTFKDWVAKHRKSVKKASDTAPEEPKPAATPADITLYFQPVHAVVPPGSDPWGGEKTAAYTDALAQLGRSMQDIGAGSKDAPAFEAARQNHTKALDAARQLAKTFKSVGIDGTVERLLLEPVQHATEFLNAEKADQAEAEKVNRALRTFCAAFTPSLTKYPFNQASSADLALNDFGAYFAPESGRVWTFRSSALAELTAQEGGIWKQNPASQKLKASPELLSFLNRAQQITQVFFGDTGTSPRLSFAVRPHLEENSEQLISLRIGGQTREFSRTSQLRQQFTWPAAQASEQEAVGRSGTKGSTFPFSSHDGPWAVFRMFADAEPRAMKAMTVEWKRGRGPSGRSEPFDQPVRLDIVDFPNAADVFNPKFWSLQCPAKAAQ